MPRACIFAALLILANAVDRETAYADTLIYRYEADALPYAPGVGWLDGLCVEPCTESLRDGHFILQWPRANDIANYTHVISNNLGEPPLPETLWVEWRFRSNHPLPRNAFDCDAWFTVNYGSIHEIALMYGDAAISFSGDDALLGLALDEFHSFRFESRDGVRFSFSVDGTVFSARVDDDTVLASYLQFGGMGGCRSDQIPNMRNEWDFVRYGTLASGERIVGSDPPAGFLDPTAYPALDRFTVTYDSPNYAYVDEIAVGVREANGEPGIGNAVPVVLQTLRLDNGSPEVVEIRLDRPIPPDARTRFTFSDGVSVNMVNYTYVRGDADADDDFDLADFAALQNCFGSPSGSNHPICTTAAFDFDGDSSVSEQDFASYVTLFSGPL